MCVYTTITVPGEGGGGRAKWSYIVSGLENPLTYHSAPHGAGRRMSRTAAKKQFTMQDLEAQMGDVVYKRTDKLIDEIPSAYKSIDAVMQNSKDLVVIEHELRQIVNVKGV